MAKTQILNVVEISNGVLSNITSFIIKDKKSRQKAIDKAEKLFTEIAIENGMKNNLGEINEALEKGGYDNNNGQDVLLSWSNKVLMFPLNLD